MHSNPNSGKINSNYSKENDYQNNQYYQNNKSKKHNYVDYFEKSLSLDKTTSEANQSENFSNKKYDKYENYGYDNYNNENYYKYPQESYNQDYNTGQHKGYKDNYSYNSGNYNDQYYNDSPYNQKTQKKKRTKKNKTRPENINITNYLAKYPTFPEKSIELINELVNEELECIICHENIDSKVEIWNCKRCFNLVHMKCIYQWIDKYSKSIILLINLTKAYLNKA